MRTTHSQMRVSRTSTFACSLVVPYPVNILKHPALLVLPQMNRELALMVMPHPSLKYQIYEVVQAVLSSESIHHHDMANSTDPFNQTRTDSQYAVWILRYR